MHVCMCEVAEKPIHWHITSVMRVCAWVSVYNVEQAALSIPISALSRAQRPLSPRWLYFSLWRAIDIRALVILIALWLANVTDKFFSSVFVLKLMWNWFFISFSLCRSTLADGSPSSTSTQGFAQGGREPEEPIGGFQYGETEECHHWGEDCIALRPGYVACDKLLKCVVFFFTNNIHLYYRCGRWEEPAAGFAGHHRIRSDQFEAHWDQWEESAAR